MEELPICRVSILIKHMTGRQWVRLKCHDVTRFKYTCYHFLTPLIKIKFIVRSFIVDSEFLRVEHHEVFSRGYKPIATDFSAVTLKLDKDDRFVTSWKIRIINKPNRLDLLLCFVGKTSRRTVTNSPITFSSDHHRRHNFPFPQFTISFRVEAFCKNETNASLSCHTNSFMSDVLRSRA